MNEPAPKLGKIPIPAGPFTVHSPHYRVLAGPEQFVIVNTVEAVKSAARSSSRFPLRDVDDTLHHLLVIEMLVAAGVLLALALGVVGRAARAASARADG